MNHTMTFTAALAAALTLPAASVAQSITIDYNRLADSIRADVATVPTQQFWLSESGDFTNWTRHTFVDRITTIDLGPPLAGSQFFRLQPLYGQVTWSAAIDMPVARDAFTGGVIDEKLYVFGGNGDPDGVNLNRLDIYDLDTGEWTQGANYDLGIEEITSAVVGDKLYVFGGWAGFPVSVSLCYDSKTDSWSDTASKPTPTQATTAVAWRNEILLLGGDRGDETNYATVVEAYDTQSNTWRTVTQLPDITRWFGAGIHEDILYLIGGMIRESFTFQNKVRRFDLENETWLPEIDGSLPYPVMAYYSSACPIVNGKVIIVGGGTTKHGGFTVTNVASEAILSDSVTVYDIPSNTFSTNSPLPEGVSSHLFLLAEDKMLSLGGNIGSIESDERTNRMYIGAFGE